MPKLASTFASDVNQALGLAEAGERIRFGSPPGSVARAELTLPKLVALYEMAYLRIFISWESFLEASFLRYLCGYAAPPEHPQTVRRRFRSIADAETAWLGSAHFVSWVAVDRVLKRSKNFVTDGVHEQVLDSNKSRLEWFAAVRHRIAHESAYSRKQFDNATIQLAARRYPASLAGRFLRDWTAGSPVPQRWLTCIAEELENLSVQIVH